MPSLPLRGLKYQIEVSAQLSRLSQSCSQDDLDLLLFAGFPLLFHEKALGGLRSLPLATFQFSLSSHKQMQQFKYFHTLERIIYIHASYIHESRIHISGVHHEYMQVDF